MKLKQLFCLIFILSGSLTSFSGDNFFSKMYLEPVYYYGSVLPQCDAIGYLLQDHIRGFQMNLGINTDGSKKWQRTLNYPRLGFGYYHSSLGNNEIFGHLNSLFGTIAIKTFNHKFFINIEHNISAGIGMVSKRYYLHKNSLDLAFTSPLNFFLQYALLFPARLSPAIEFYAGPCFTHASVANLVEPNHGLHMTLMRVGSRFNLHPAVYKEEAELRTRKDTALHRFTVVVAGGFRQYSRFTDDINWIYAVIPEYCYKISPYFGIGAALGLYYDTSIKPYMLEYENKKAGPENLFHTTAHASFQLFMGQVSFLFQPGIYLYKNFELYEKQPYKFGFRYQFQEHLSAGIILKAHWIAQADVLEFGIGYTF